MAIKEKYLQYEVGKDPAKSARRIDRLIAP